MDSNKKREIARAFTEGQVIIHSSGQTIFSPPPPENIIPSASEQTNKVAINAGDLSMDGIHEDGDRFACY